MPKRAFCETKPNFCTPARQSREHRAKNEAKYGQKIGRNEPKRAQIWGQQVAEDEQQLVPTAGGGLRGKRR